MVSTSSSSLSSLSAATFLFNNSSCPRMASSRWFTRFLYAVAISYSRYKVLSRFYRPAVLCTQKKLELFQISFLWHNTDNVYDWICRVLAQTLQLLAQKHCSSGSDPLQLCLRRSVTLAQITVGFACRRRRVYVQSSVAVGLQKKVLEFSGLW